MRRILRDGWVLFGLSLGQILITFTFVTFVPYGYLLNKARSDEPTKALLEKLTAFAQDKANVDIEGAELLQQMGPTIRQLLETVPWFWLALGGTIVIYPFLGWWSGRLFFYPQVGGLLILTSVISQQNISLVPRIIQYQNIADVALGLGSVLFIIALQFALLTAGILAQRGQVLLDQAQQKGEVN